MLSVQPHSHIEQAVQSLGALGQLCQISILEGFRETVEQRPDITLLEFAVSGLTPLIQDGGNEPVRADTNITRTDDEVMGFFVLNHDFLVGFDPFVLMMPLAHELADGPFDELRQIPVNVNSVLATELHLSAER